MDKIQELIRAYLRKNLDSSLQSRTEHCPDENTVLDYVHQKLDDRESRLMEDHLAQCNYCLSQLSIAFEAQKTGGMTHCPIPPVEGIEKAKGLVGHDKRSLDERMTKQRKMRKNLFLAGALIAFTLSFFIHRYFMQFLVVTLILGLRWALESENARTLVMVIDSWRKHSHDDDEEISRRLKNKV